MRPPAAAYTRRVAASVTSRGFLRLYLGAAAGVGKTYQMLGDARLAAEEGADLVIGYLEPHGRAADRGARARRSSARRCSATARAAGPRASPTTTGCSSAGRASRSSTSSRTRTPRGSARPKRYEDVERAARRGIDVWTTVNIQHLESLNSRIRALTGVDGARDVPRPLAARGRRDPPRRPQPGGRCASASRAASSTRPSASTRALTGFFTVENLTALRALVLHELAEVAAAELATSAAPGARPIERVLVAIGGRRDSYRLIRAGARLARRSDAELYVLAVEPQDGRVDAETAQVLDEAEALTRSLGGIFLRRRADNPAAEIIREAEAQRITQIVVGKSRRSRARRLPGRHGRSSPARHSRRRRPRGSRPHRTTPVAPTAIAASCASIPGSDPKNAVSGV